MFEARELMCLWDGLSALAVSPLLRDNSEAEEFILTVADKIEKQLADMGYVFDGNCKYPGN